MHFSSVIGSPTEKLSSAITPNSAVGFILTEKMQRIFTRRSKSLTKMNTILMNSFLMMINLLMLTIDHENSYAEDQAYFTSKRKMENGSDSETLSLALIFLIIPDRYYSRSVLLQDLAFQLSVRNPFAVWRKRMSPSQ